MVVPNLVTQPHPFSTELTSHPFRGMTIFSLYFNHCVIFRTVDALPPSKGQHISRTLCLEPREPRHALVKSIHIP